MISNVAVAIAIEMVPDRSLDRAGLRGPEGASFFLSVLVIAARIRSNRSRHRVS